MSVRIGKTWKCEIEIRLKRTREGRKVRRRKRKIGKEKYKSKGRK